jgi:hypothetical protein
MSYIGQGLPADTFQGFTTDSFTGDGSATTFTLSKEPFSEDTLIVVINNVIQKPTTNFTVSGTTLTIVGTAVADGDVIYAIHMGGPLPIGGAAELDLNGASDKLILDADADTTISADTDDQIDIKVGDADILNITNSSSDAVITQGVQDKDILFKGNDGGSAVTALTLDMSDAGAATLNNGLTLTDGNITFAGSGHGIHLGVTSATDSNLLHDYEEGTFTAGWTASTAAPSGVNYAANTGFYVKVGNHVFLNLYLALSNWSSAGTGNARITGLPFSATSTTNFYAAINVGYSNAFGNAPVGGLLSVGNNYIDLFKISSADSRSNMNSYLQLTSPDMSGDESIVISVMYQTDS